MSQRYTYPDPTLSLWQASVAEVHRRRSSVQARMAGSTATAQLAVTNMASPDDLMAPVATLAQAIVAGQSPDTLFTTEGRGAAASMVQTAVATDCTRTAAKFLWAEMKGDSALSQQYAGELKFAVCDAAGWAECVTTYLAYKASLANPLYRPNKNVVVDLGTKTKLAIIGDWGTGNPVAINVLQEVAKLKPDLVIHVGDVYYACTQNEAQTNFCDVCQSVLGSSVPVYSLCGNHDMYSGGAGYYWLVDKIGQQASYFCLQNDNWQFLAMDTGFHDNNPMTVSSNMTSLVSQDGWSEAAWHLDKISNAGGRKIVLFSHHQLFSPFGSVGTLNGTNYGYNLNLLQNFQSVLPQISWWFWGHEHTLAIYAPCLGLARGRCVGASAIPVSTDQQSYTSASGLAMPNGAALPTWDPNGVLGNNGDDYNNCFAMMTLNGSSANVDYYQVPMLQAATKLNVTDAV